VRAPGSLRGWAGALAVCALALLAADAHAQAGRRPLAPQDPQDLQQPRRAPMTLTPTLTVTEEFNDNIFLNNDRKEWDFITGFTPGIAFEMEQPTYRLAAAYSFTAELYARHPELDHFFDRHNLAADAFWQPTPRLTLSAFETFTFTTETNLVSQEGVATGRDRASSNSLGGAISWEVDPRTTLRGGGSWTTISFDSDELRDSDTYRLDAAVDHRLTPRLTGSASYEVAFFRIDEEEDVTTHTPRLGVIFRFTETLTGVLRAGPTFEVEEDGGTHVLPAITASLRQRTAWGSVGADYNSAVGIAGGLGGTTFNQSLGLTVQVTTLMRGLVLDFGPRYSSVQSHGDAIDVTSFTVPLTASYRITPWLALVGAYTFFHQRSDSQLTDSAGLPLANDADQNRLWLGVQVGYPIRFD
jgi:hypothetical protein